jgi:hypothetical protein
VMDKVHRHYWLCHFIFNWIPGHSPYRQFGYSACRSACRTAVWPRMRRQNQSDPHVHNNKTWKGFQCLFSGLGCRYQASTWVGMWCLSWWMNGWMVMLRPASHVFVFMNESPDMEKLSADRSYC